MQEMKEAEVGLRCECEKPDEPMYCGGLFRYKIPEQAHLLNPYLATFVCFRCGGIVSREYVEKMVEESGGKFVVEVGDTLPIFVRLVVLGRIGDEALKEYWLGQMATAGEKVNAIIERLGSFINDDEKIKGLVDEVLNKLVVMSGKKRGQC